MGEKTSKGVAAAASRVLRGKGSKADAKRVAGSALTQREKARPKVKAKARAKVRPRCSGRQRR